MVRWSSARIDRGNRGVNDFEGMFPCDVEVGEIELQRVRFGQEFLGIECVEEFQKLKIFA